jgi:DNA-binding beta-propeller fold protein YncE
LHSRDVVINAARGRAYVNAALTGKIHVFDTATLEELAPIQISTADGREAFASMSLDLDPAKGQLYTISRGARAVAAVDLESGTVRAFEVPELSQGSGVAHDPETGRLYAVSQDGNNLVVLDGATGAVLRTRRSVRARWRWPLIRWQVRPMWRPVRAARWRCLTATASWSVTCRWANCPKT